MYPEIQSHQRIAIGALLVLAAFSTGFTALAQQRLPQPVIPVRGPLRNVNVGAGTSKSTPRVIYANTQLSGYFMIPGAGEEFIDHAVIVGSLDHDTVTEVELGYATYGTTVDLRFRLYPGYTGFCGFRAPPAIDLSLTGLPGGGRPGAAVSTVLSIDLNALGECFFLEEGPFGYSIAFTDSVSGMLLAGGGTGNMMRFDWTPSTSPSCGSWWFGGLVWAGFHAELSAHDGQDTFSGGCGNGVTLEMAGATCPGSLLTFTISGANTGDLWALALGTSIGTGLGGTIGGCPIDVLPVVPILPMGPLTSQPQTIPATVTLLSGTLLGIQVITRNGSAGVWDSSNTEILFVP